LAFSLLYVIFELLIAKALAQAVISESQISQLGTRNSQLLAPFPPATFTSLNAKPLAPAPKIKEQK